MNLNLNTVFSIPSTEDTYAANSKAISINKIIKGALIVSLALMILFSNLYLEYICVICALVVARSVYFFCKDLMSFDLHFSSDDISLQEIIDDLWD